MFEHDHMSDFDLQMRSILESGREEVPAGAWDKIADGLDKAARGKAVKLWFYRAGVAVAAAAVVAGAFLFSGRQQAEIVAPQMEGQIAVVQNLEEPSLSSEAVAQVAQVAQVIQVVEQTPEQTSEQTLRETSEHSQGQTLEQKPEQGLYDAPSSDEASVAAQNACDATDNTVSQDITTVTLPDDSSWVQEESTRRKIRTSLVIAGIAGSNSPGNTAKTNIFKSPASENIPAASCIQSTGSETSYGIPVSVGVGVKIHLARRWALSAGVNYTLLTSKFNGKYIEVNDGIVVSQQSGQVKNMQHYIGVPVNAYYNIVDRDFIDFYTYAGGAVEKCVYNTYSLQTTPVINHTEKVKGVQWSANVGIGVQFKLGKHVGIYIDPSLRYYFGCGQPKSIRTAQPLMFGFEAGFRFNL